MKIDVTVLMVTDTRKYLVLSSGKIESVTEVIPSLD